MGVLSVVNDPETGRWYRNPGVQGPTLFDVRFRYEPDSDDVFDPPSGFELEYTLRGFDFRYVDSPEEAIEEAKYRWKLKNRPSPYTEEQIEARQSYFDALKFIEHARMLIDIGAFTEGANDTATTLNMAIRRQVVQDRYNALKALGIYFAGGPGDL